jgi:hypothetical protein
LAVDIHLVKPESVGEQDLSALLLALAEDVEEDGLLVVVLELDAGVVAEEKLDHLGGKVVPAGESCEVEGRLSELRLDLVGEFRGGELQHALDGLQRPA